MFQILKRALTSPLQFALSLGFVLGIWLAWRVARRNRQRGAQCFGRLAASVERGWSGLAPAARQENRSRWMIQSLLLQRAPWEEVRPWTQELSRPASGMELAFSSYFADENFEQAHLAATNWCRAVESEVEDQKAMQAFFARYGDKSSKQRLNEIFADMDAPKSGDAPDETLSKVGTIPRRTSVFSPTTAITTRTCRSKPRAGCRGVTRAPNATPGNSNVREQAAIIWACPGFASTRLRCARWA